MRRGFSLVEVLLAFVILTGSLTVVASAFSRHISFLRSLQDSLTAYSLGESGLIQEALRDQIRIPEEALSSNPKFTTQITHTDIPLEDAVLRGLFFEEITARTAWNQREAVRSVSVSMGFPKKPVSESSP